MDRIVHKALDSYFHALELKGYMPWHSVKRLLILVFLRDFVYNDYRATLTLEDYRAIEKALNCLYGTTCLISYPDYLKMGKLHLGEMTEMAQRVKNLEDTSVLKLVHDLNSVNEVTNSDITVVENE